MAKLKMKYKTPEDYTAFNGIELYQGKVVASLAAGYVYDGEFARVEEGKVVGAATCGKFGKSRIISFIYRY